jgi:hypothetical protein
MVGCATKKASSYLSQIYEGSLDKTALSSRLEVPAGETGADKVLLQKDSLDEAAVEY